MSCRAVHDVQVRVLVVEDHVALANRIGEGLRDAGMAVDVVYDGATALQSTSTVDYDVVVLDRDLPAVHGDRVCRELVKDGSTSRILMLTAAADADRPRRRPRTGRRRLSRQAVRVHRTGATHPCTGAPRTGNAGHRVARRAAVRSGAAPRVAVGHAAHADPQGIWRARVPSPAPTVRPFPRNNFSSTLGRARRPVQQHRRGHRGPAAPQTRRSATDRDRRRRRLPAMRAAAGSSQRAVAADAALLALFAVCGAVLVAVTYGLVDQPSRHYPEFDPLEPRTSDLRWKSASKQREEPTETPGRSARRSTRKRVTPGQGATRTTLNDLLLNSLVTARRGYVLAAIAGLDLGGAHLAADTSAHDCGARRERTQPLAATCVDRAAR